MTERRRLEPDGPEILCLGLGTFSFSHAYGHAEPDESLRTLLRALELGCQLLDTADSYGAGENEAWLGRVLQAPRDDIVLCTKIGLVCGQAGNVIGRNGRPEYIAKAVDASLRRLRTNTLDVCILHRADPDVPIEEAVGALAEAACRGKVRLVGLCEVDKGQLLRAHAVHPVAVLQSEYSLWTRDPEAEIIPLCQELGIAFLAFSPLGRGMFTRSPAPLASEADFRASLPRFQRGNLEKNLVLVQQLTDFAARKGYSPSQIALAWVLHAGSHVFAISGTRSCCHLEENMRALEVHLEPEDIAELKRIFSPDGVAGERYPETSVFNPLAQGRSV
jgi:aryl-alcohol dehydrogenase-like predicted oxidoreductase